jgi:hypothetical protein
MCVVNNAQVVSMVIFVNLIILFALKFELLI